MVMYHSSNSLFFFNDTATTEIYTLSLHDALPICHDAYPAGDPGAAGVGPGADLGLHVLDLDARQPPEAARVDRKSTRLNSSHANISYAVFRLKKKKTRQLLLAHHLGPQAPLRHHP